MQRFIHPANIGHRPQGVIELDPYIRRMHIILSNSIVKPPSSHHSRPRRGNSLSNVHHLIRFV
jgi:hypothetical protein